MPDIQSVNQSDHLLYKQWIGNHDQCRWCSKNFKASDQDSETSPMISDCSVTTQKPSQGWLSYFLSGCRFKQKESGDEKMVCPILVLSTVDMQMESDKEKLITELDNEIKSNQDKVKKSEQASDEIPKGIHKSQKKTNKRKKLSIHQKVEDLQSEKKRLDKIKRYIIEEPQTICSIEESGTDTKYNPIDIMKNIKKLHGFIRNITLLEIIMCTPEQSDSAPKTIAILADLALKLRSFLAENKTKSRNGSKVTEGKLIALLDSLKITEEEWDCICSLIDTLNCKDHIRLDIFFSKKNYSKEDIKSMLTGISGVNADSNTPDDQVRLNQKVNRLYEIFHDRKNLNKTGWAAIWTLAGLSSVAVVAGLVLYYPPLRELIMECLMPENMADDSQDGSEGIQFQKAALSEPTIHNGTYSCPEHFYACHSVYHTRLVQVASDKLEFESGPYTWHGVWDYGPTNVRVYSIKGFKFLPGNMTRAIHLFEGRQFLRFYGGKWERYASTSYAIRVGRDLSKYALVQVQALLRCGRMLIGPTMPAPGGTYPRTEKVSLCLKDLNQISEPKEVGLGIMRML